MSILSDIEIEACCNPEIVARLLGRAIETAKVFRSTRLHEDAKRRDAAFDSLYTALQAAGLTMRDAIGSLEVTEDSETKFRERFKPMIEPFVGHQVRTRPLSIAQGFELPPSSLVTTERGGAVMHEEKLVSYGLSSYGYDLRVGNQFKIFTNVNSSIVDPKNFDPKAFVDFQGDVCIIPPNSFVLCASLEYFRIPRNVSVIVVGKSTYARCGIDCLVTPLEAGWEGHVTLEFANTSPLPAKLYAGEGGCQAVFFRGNVPCRVSYADRGGKYMHQVAGPVVSRV